MPPHKPPLLPCLFFLLSLLAGCHTDSAPGVAELAADQPRPAEPDRRHFWRKREIEEVSRRIIERELGHREALRFAADRDGGDGRYRFRLIAPPRGRLGFASDEAAFAVQADLANGRIISIHCRQNDGSQRMCYPYRDPARS
ncbi:hypothetical protein KIF53_03670 [Chromobacterium subtsugae]|uniref:Lipoprotein n=1 Tax=Chromobacterium subtsugae TaxID=251747 RepID=A0ABS7FBM4_9NEIS|nr:MULTISPECIES: hypothetical protein [Chromobacterium]KUM02547.1 hypothetical protein Cv017_02175 [Chromobacterium subtsugae]KZE87932.1 hypothetical protein AWB61_09010 [Chromobacterium sp. F49]MBW7565427.1 hypothetical protein [Chromobacterium subtsugae]MBW8286723.1 hypothetical protein [Chromobacterium subtsugae]OBU85298.1 hypothetical protein MY55_17540 [Chromobacterium subtsugae]